MQLYAKQGAFAEAMRSTPYGPEARSAGFRTTAEKEALGDVLAEVLGEENGFVYRAIIVGDHAEVEASHIDPDHMLSESERLSVEVTLAGIIGGWNAERLKRMRNDGHSVTVPNRRDSYRATGLPITPGMNRAQRRAFRAKKGR